MRLKASRRTATGVQFRKESAAAARPDTRENHVFSLHAGEEPELRPSRRWRWARSFQETSVPVILGERSPNDLTRRAPETLVKDYTLLRPFPSESRRSTAALRVRER